MEILGTLNHMHKTQSSKFIEIRQIMPCVMYGLHGPTCDLSYFFFDYFIFFVHLVRLQYNPCQTIKLWAGGMC